MTDHWGEQDGTGEGEGYLAKYGVAIVPPPPDGSGGWFVALTYWSDEMEAYVASGDGPIVESREEALAEAGKVLDWIASRGNQDNLVQVWEQAQRDRTSHEPWSSPERPSWVWW